MRFLCGLCLAIVVTSCTCEKRNNGGESSHGSAEDGLVIHDIVVGKGATAAKGRLVKVHYIGEFEDKRVFDNSYERGQPFQFTLGGGQVIKGWEMGIVGMKTGGKRRLTIPARLAYGELGIQGVIPAGATLIFEVELIWVEPND